MTRMKKKRRVYVIKKSAIEAAINTSITRIEREGYVILPSTQSNIKSNVQKALIRGLLKNREEIDTATAALIAGAVTAAKESNSKIVTNKHLSIGWNNHIKVEGIGNCPPHRCLLRSVINRKAKLIASNTVFDNLMGDIEKEL